MFVNDLFKLKENSNEEYYAVYDQRGKPMIMRKPVGKTARDYAEEKNYRIKGGPFDSHQATESFWIRSVLSNKRKEVDEQAPLNVPKGWEAKTQPDGSTRISKQGSMSSADYKQSMADYKAKNWTPEKMADYSQRMASGQGYSDEERAANYQQQQQHFGQYADQPVQEDDVPNEKTLKQQEQDRWSHYDAAKKAAQGEILGREVDGKVISIPPGHPEYDETFDDLYRQQNPGYPTPNDPGFYLTPFRYPGEPEPAYTKALVEGGPFSYGAKKPKKGSVADLAAKKRKEQEHGKQPIEPRDHMVGVARVVKDVAEGISVVDQDYDLDQMHLTLDIEGKKVYFTYWDYEEDFSNAERRDVFDQLQEQPWYKGLDHPTKMEILDAAYRAIRGLEPQEYRPTVGDEPLDEQGVAEGSIYKKDQDLSSIPTQELEAFVRKHWGGGVPTYGQGESVKRAMRELRRRQKQGVAEGLNEFASTGGGGGRWYSDDQLYDIIGEDWLEAFDVSGDRGNIDLNGERARLFLAQEAEAWLTDRGYRVNVLDVRDDGDELSWYIQGPLYQGLDEDWKKVNRKDRTPGMSRKAVKAYRRENPGSKLQTAVTTKPSKLKKGSKSAKRRKSFCARMKGMKRAHAGAKTKRDPNSPINKALRRWNCESIEEMRDLVMIAEQRISAMREDQDKKLSDQEKQSLRQTVKDIDYTKPPTDTKARLSPEEKKELRQTVKDYEYPKPTNEASAREKLDRRFQELRKKRGAPDPEYYKELGKSYDIEDDQQRYARQAELKKKYGITNEDRERYVEELGRAGYEIVTESATLCPECGGAAYADRMLAEKQDACYHKVKSRYKVWPSAYASGALVRCRKVGAANWGNKSKK